MMSFLLFSLLCLPDLSRVTQVRNLGLVAKKTPRETLPYCLEDQEKEKLRASFTTRSAPVLGMQYSGRGVSIQNLNNTILNRGCGERDCRGSPPIFLRFFLPIRPHGWPHHAMQVTKLLTETCLYSQRMKKRGPWDSESVREILESRKIDKRIPNSFGRLTHD